MKMAFLCGCWVAWAWFGQAQSSAATLIPTQSTWRFFKGSREASAPIDAWRKPGFDDSIWTSGPAPFHYGENIVGGTTLADMRNSYAPVFLRRTIDLADPGAVQQLRLRAICDDGFIAWINGVEVARSNVPAGDRAFDTFASAAVTEPVSFIDYALPKPGYLSAGLNVVAIQVFNASLTSSDLQWDGELISMETDLTPPRIASVDPPPGTVEDMTNVIITFTEPVSGVQASDFFLGSQAATAVQNSGARYTFTFAKPDAGPVELRWDADTLITDLASPPNRFDPAAAGTWQYQVIDRTAPTLVEITPRPGLTVRSLTQVEIRFSEPVEGVDASDLLVNGVAAAGVSGEMAGPYRFQFPPPIPGAVRFAWAAGHGIHDRATPANLFSAPDWSVELNSNFVAPTVRINEFVAANIAAGGLKDEDGELQDWIEIYNQGSSPVNLNGWSLTDDREDPDRWIFPSVTLASGQFLVVFASGKDRKPTTSGAKLHTNFKLNPAGEYLALLNPESPRAAATQFDPSYPEQRNDYSYGYDSAGPWRYFRTPTPGATNGASALEGVVPPPHLSVNRGWFDAPFPLIVTSSLPGVTCRYTTDGSEPTETNGKVYSDPLRIANTTTLRVAGFKANMLPSSASTHTYLFADDILRQSNKPPGFPTGATVMAGFPSDYEMDPEIVSNPLYRGVMKDALLALPTLSIVCRTDDLFGAANGIYTHPTTRGPSWERPCSVEFIPLDGSRGFQISAGVQIQGNAAREPQKQPKHPFRLVFKGDYGPAWLEFPLFPDSPVTRFDTLVLRADFNFSWLHWDPNQRLRGQRMRDAWTKDSMRAMGGLASHNRYVHLFLNGLYWGIYDPSERPDGAFAAAYLGGRKEDYDVMNEGAAVDGDNRAYNTMLGITNLSDPAAYTRMQQYLDVTQYIDYMLLHFYIGHQDWGQNKNWYAIRPKDGRRGFAYVPWDGENILDSVNFNRVSNSDTPSGLHSKLVANAEYRLAFADRVRKHLFNDGALTPAASSTRWLNRARAIETAIVAESARWGDYRRDVHQFQSGPYQLYTRDDQWRTEQNRLLSQYFPQRTSIVLSQLRAAGLYPDVAAPDLSQFGGRVERSFLLTLSAPSGTIYFTTDGSDPRVPVLGEIAASAAPYGGPMTLTNSVRIKTRALRQGAWSALTEAEFQVADVGLPLRFTEIMYHPVGGDAFEFVELQNLGGVALDVTGFSLTGVDYVFPLRTVLNPGQFVVLASSLGPASFSARYGGLTPDGYFNGSLANGGERLELRDREGRTVTSVTYSDDTAWPSRADGQGASLEVIDADANPNDPANWFARSIPDGSPGRRSSLPPLGPLRLNEISAQAEGDPTSAETSVDWIELVNTSGSPASLDGWTLTDHGARPFVFPAGTVVPPNGFLVVACDGLTNAAGFHAAFKLDQDGETIGLYDLTQQRVDAVTFGHQASGFSVGRVGADSVWQLAQPTRGVANQAAELAAASSLKINEWLANGRAGEEDWLELFNPDASRPAALSGLVMATDNALFRIPSLAFIPARGFLRLWADERAGRDHLDFKLTAAGGSIALLDSLGQEIDRVAYQSQTEGVSEGRFPDGASSIVSFAAKSSPGQSNALSNQQDITLNEILARDASGAGWVELSNSGVTSFDLAGCQISLEADGGKSWSFPAGSKMGPSEFLVIGFDARRAASTTAISDLQSGRSLELSGGAVNLRDAAGRRIDSVEYGVQITGLSVGRSGGAWHLLAAPTPGKANAALAALGPANAVRINEWLAAPAQGDDWFELFNTDPRPVSLAGLRVTDDPSLVGQTKSQIGPLSFIGAGSWVKLTADGAPEKGMDHVNFNLDQLGEVLRLYAADGSQIDAVDFGLQQNGVSEGRLTDGASEIGRLVVGPTPGSSNTPPPGDRDTDGDGLSDAWELANGTNPSVPDADADPDRDGLTNRQEFMAGTNPNDADSGLKMTRVNLSPASVSFEFLAVSNHTYSVQFKRTIDAAVWSKLADVGALTTNRIETVVDPGPLTETRFYRLVTPAGP